MGALFICRIQASGGLRRCQLENLSIGISMTILTTLYTLHLSQLCCFLTFHFSPKKLQSYFWCQYNAVSRLPKLKSKKCKKQTNLVKFQQQHKPQVMCFLQFVSSSAGRKLLRYLSSQFIQSTVYFEGNYRESVCPQTNSRFCHLTQPFPSKCNRSQYILIKCSNSKVKKIQFDWAKI